MEQLKMLWELQELEYEIFGKEKKLQEIPSVRRYQKSKKELSIFDANLNLKEKDNFQVKKNIQRLEMELQGVTDSIKEISRQLYSGESRSSRELESLEKKLKSLEKEQEELEDRALAYMETLENGGAVLEEMLNKKNKDEVKIKREKELARQDFFKVKKDLEELKERRQLLEQGIEGNLLQKYRELSARFQGKCVSLVKNSYCGICHVSLPSSFRALMLTPHKLVFCENCGSLLVAGD